VGLPVRAVGVLGAAGVDPERTEAVSDVIAVTLAIALVGAVLFAVWFYPCGQYRDVDPPEERGFNLEDFRSDQPHPDEETPE
jgi:nitrogen fixation-related uncharacterized protein